MPTFQEVARRQNKVVYRDGDEMIKVFNDNKPVSDIFNEALNLARVTESGINAPKPLWVKRVDGDWAFATTRIAGRALDDLMREHPEKEDKYLKLFVDFQVRLHSYRAPLLQRQKDKYTRMIKSLTDVLDATTRYELEMRLDGMPNEVEICHGDFNPSNVIVGDDGELYACDWAHATQGSGAADAAMTYLLFELDDHAMAERYLDLYCMKSDTPKQIVRNWLSIVAASELSRHRDEHKEFLLSWIDIADYQ